MSQITLSEIGQVAIVVSDVDAALGFYRDILGLPLLFRAGPNLAFLAAGSVRIMLTAPEAKGYLGHVGHTSLLYFRVDDVRVAYTALTARGAREESGPERVAKLRGHHLWMAFLRDPDGNLVGLMEERRPASETQDHGEHDERLGEGDA